MAQDGTVSAHRRHGSRTRERRHFLNEPAAVVGGLFASVGGLGRFGGAVVPRLLSGSCASIAHNLDRA